MRSSRSLGGVLRDGAADSARKHGHTGGGKDHIEKATCHGGADRPKAGTLAQSSFTPDAFMIAPHFVVSSAMNAAKSCGEPAFGSAPSRPRFEFIAGDFKP